MQRFGKLFQHFDNPQNYLTSSKLSRKINLGKAIHDVVSGAHSYELWHWLAIKDVKLRYKQTLLGPLWFPASLLIFATGLSFVFSSFFGNSTTNFLPYVATGLAVWGFMSRCIIESCHAFASADSVIGQIDAPVSIHLFRMIERNGLIFLHEFLAIILLLLLYSLVTFQGILLFILAVPLVVLAVFGASMFLATVCLRYRDLSQIIELTMRFFFFLTPVFWVPAGDPIRETMLQFNPFSHALDLTRGALLQDIASPLSWVVAIACAVGACGLGIFTFAYCRRSIQFWV